MRQEFNDLLQKLSTDEYAAVSVTDNDLRLQMLNATLGSKIAEEYGSVKNYFERLFNRGSKTLILQEYRKNGNTFKKIGVPFTVSLSSKQPENHNNNRSGRLLGVFDEERQLEIYSDSRSLPEVKAENTVLKAKVETLEAENKRQEKEIWQLENSTEAKKNNTDIVKEVLQTLKPIGMAFAQSKSGLNAPAQPQFSENKQKLFNLLQNPNFDEATANFLLHVNNTIIVNPNTYEEFLRIINPPKTEKENAD